MLRLLWAHGAFFKKSEDSLLLSICVTSCSANSSSFLLLFPHHNQVLTPFLRDWIWNLVAYPESPEWEAWRLGYSSSTKSTLCRRPTAHWLRRSQKFVLSKRKDCFLGKGICISFFICLKIMLWVNYQKLASKKIMMTMRHVYVVTDSKPFAEYLWRSTVCQAHGEHKHAPYFLGV